MYSPERRRQLGHLQGLREVRKRQAAGALQRARAAREAAKESLEQAEQALAMLEKERNSLFENHRGMTHRGGLLTLRRRASEIEMRRIHLSISRVQLEADVAAAVRAETEARAAMTTAQKQSDKLDHVAQLWRRDAQIHMLRQQDNAE